MTSDEISDIIYSHITGMTNISDELAEKIARYAIQDIIKNHKKSMTTSTSIDGYFILSIEKDKPFDEIVYGSFGDLNEAKKIAEDWNSKAIKNKIDIKWKVCRVTEVEIID